MNINIGNYLETVIKKSNLSKKDICNEINNRYKINEKPLSYTTFSNNIKEGNISLNEAIALATIVDIDLNKIVSSYKNKFNKENKMENTSKENKDYIGYKNSEIVEILNNEVSEEGVIYEKENVYRIDYECYEAFYLSEDGNKAIMQCVLFTDDENLGFITEKAYFTEFLNTLGEANLTLERFNALSINEKLDFLACEARDYFEITGEDEKEISFDPSKYEYK